MVTVTITNEDVIRQLNELAEREGKSLTQVVIDAVTDRLDRITPPRTAEEAEEKVQYWLKRGQQIREENPDWDPHADIAALYDPETGLPT